MSVNDLKGKSARRPLRDSTNDTAQRFSSKSVYAKKKFPENSKVDEVGKSSRDNEELVKEDDGIDCALDLLFLVHSDLSSVLRQIDELVVQATKLKTTSREGRKEIKSFRSVLSETLSSLKPWVPRFQKTLSSPSMQAETQEEQSLVSTTFLEDEPFEVKSPEQTKFESLISPSPLVSWRGDFNVERGRQLFLLTPLAVCKAISTKHKELHTVEFKEINPNTARIQSLDISEEAGKGLKGVGGEVIKTTLSKPLGFVAAISESMPDTRLVSSPILKKKAQSDLFMTPCLKMSPPKSCKLLEPASHSCHPEKGMRKSTPYPIGIHNLSGSQTSEFSGSESSGGLALKYPELLGIQHAPGVIKKDLESSPDWMFSPPKTCVLLEPQDEKQVDKIGAEHDVAVTCAAPEHKEEPPSETKAMKEHVGGDSLLVENTPARKELESIMRTGRRAGESTLKRELWTKFEAASSFTLLMRGTASKKGFLDMLEEVSGNEESLTPDGPR